MRDARDGSAAAPARHGAGAKVRDARDASAAAPARHGAGAMILPAFTRRRIDRIAEDALLAAGAAGRLPTPLEDVQRAAGITARHDIGALPPGLATPGRRLLGALWFAPRAVYVDLSQPPPRRRFTDAHEAMHALCPWHEAVLREDTEDELFRGALAAIEAEANRGAARLIFQGDRFARRIAGERFDLATARNLAAAHGASLRATLHQLAEEHPDPVALLHVGRFPDRDGRLPVWRAVASPAFRRRFGPAAPVAETGPGAPLRALLDAARAFAAPDAVPVPVGGAPGTAEVHFNRRCFLVLLAAGRRAGLRPAA